MLSLRNLKSIIFPPGKTFSVGAALFWNLLLLFLIYTLCRIEFLLENRHLFSQAFADNRILQLLSAGIRFDTPGIFYSNLPYIFLLLLPLLPKERPGFYSFCKWLFCIVNSIAVIANIADSIYFPFTLRRTTCDVAAEFSNEGNILKIILSETVTHWYLGIFAILLIICLIKGYVSPSPVKLNSGYRHPRLAYYLSMTGQFIIVALFSIGAVRGGWFRNWHLYLIAVILAYSAWLLRSNKKLSIPLYVLTLFLLIIAPLKGVFHRDIRPIALSNAASFTRHPGEIALVLNTPFSIIRTVNATPFHNPGFFSDNAELEKVYSPVHTPSSLTPVSNKNIVVIIIESFGREYIGSLNKDMLGRDYEGFTPFTDSLVNKSAVWEHSFCNGRKSIDGMPSILAGIPMFVKPFILTPAAFNKIEGLPAILRKQGYSTAFFHGARTGSMGFDGFARSVGFSNYYGKEDFNNDSRFNGDKDFDGYWAIWDEPFLQYYAMKMNEMPQPFMTAVFTASSHHPFNIPDKYNKSFTEGELPIHKCIRYTDHALKKFFETASQQPWFENTIFVITSDHTNQSNHPEYMSDIGGFRAPVIFYDPSGSIPTGMLKGVAQQTDIMPTVLNILGSKKPFVAFGNDLFSTPAEERWAVNQTNGIYQFVADKHFLQFDGKKSVGLFSIDDYTMQRNILSRNPALAAKMERKLKGIIQQYMVRMISDRLTPSGSQSKNSSNHQ